ncbi:hypothetical protein HY358_02255 [Candidatus Roizmanbacteria bacterium]|nr:hypothetical protein [Candidatus Roizmanbacteria bacterium]
MDPKNHTPIHHIIQKHAVAIAPSKESEPILVNQESSTQPKEIHKVVERYALDEAVNNHVEVVKENVVLDTELQEAGVETVESTRFPDYRAVNLPLPDNKVLLGLHAPITSSLRWLAELCKYLLTQAHLTLREMRGEVVRVRS